MSVKNFSPKFIRANVFFTVNDRLLNGGQHLVNTQGVPGFKWSQVDPMKARGKKTLLTIEVLSQVEPFKFHCNGIFTCEQSEGGNTLGLIFLLTDDVKKNLEQIIEREGTQPEYVRKFPRIPYNENITMMPSKAIYRFFFGSEDILAVGDLENLSPSGFQISTEDPRVLNLAPGEVLRVQLCPRGELAEPVLLNTAIKRIIHTQDPKTGHKKWNLGLSILTISQEQKAVFAGLLKAIVGKMMNED